MQSPREKYADAQAFRMALENRLKEDGRPLSRMRKQISFERFLARLVASTPSGWVLKGAFALDIRYGDRTRTTKDLDLATRSAERQGEEMLLAASEWELPDFFSFQIKRRPSKNPRISNPAGSYAMTALVAGRTFENFSIDLCYNETPTTKPDTLQTLGHATVTGLEPILVPVVAIEQHLAEKVSAYLKQHNGRRSTRPKDLVDIVLIAEESPDIDAQRLTDALETTASRNNEDLPDTLPDPPEDWRARYATLAGETGVTTDITEAYKLAAEFLNPVLRKSATGQWHPRGREWR